MLILWSFVVYVQLNFILTKDIGINRSGVIVVESPVIKSDHYDHDIEALVNQLRTSSSIQRITSSRYMVGELASRPGLIKKVGAVIAPNVAHGNGVDENFIPFFDVKLLAGRNFMKDERADVIILSRKSATNLGFMNPEDCRGQTRGHHRGME